MTYIGKKWLKKQPLVFKLSLGVLSGVLFGIILLLSIVSSRSEMIIEQQILEHSSHSIRATVNKINYLVSETEQAVKNLRNTLQQLDARDTSSIQVTLKSAINIMYDSGLDLSHATIYSFPPNKYSSGKVYSAFAKDDEFFFSEKKINDFYSVYPQLKNAEKEEKIFWSEPYISPNSQNERAVITCVLPFKFRGRKTFSGLVSISIDLQDVLQYLQDTPFQDNGNILLISQVGMYLMHPNPDIKMKMTIYKLAEYLNQPELFQLGKKVLSGQSGYIQLPYSSVYKKPTIYFYEPVPRLNWGIFLVFACDELFKPVYDLQFIIIISAIIIILFLLFLINKICYYSIKPLTRIAKIATQYGRGNFSEKVAETYSDDEIGALSTAFQKMRTNLLEYIEKEKQDISEKQKASSELDIARKIQLSALSLNFPQHKAFQLNAKMIPARQVGGDFYDFFFVSKNRIALVIADVAGKGISAALYMMRAKEVIKHMVQYTSSISGIFERANNALCEGNSICMFVSAFLAIINLKTGVVEYVNAGHLPPFLLNEKACRKITLKPNFVLGIKEGASYQTEKMKLSPGDSLFLYTDGITEAENHKGEFYGEERLTNILRQYSDLPANISGAVISDVKGYVHGAPQSDDITMLVFHYIGQPSDTLTIEADVKKLKIVLDFIEQDMLQKDIPQSLKAKITVIVEELFVNIASYAYDDGGDVKIRTALSDDGVYSIKFIDEGKPYNPLNYQTPDVLQPLEERPIGGLGIYIVKEMADLITYSHERGKNILKVGVKIKSAD